MNNKEAYLEIMDLRAELDTAKFMIKMFIESGVDIERRVEKLEKKGGAE